MLFFCFYPSYHGSMKRTGANQNREKGSWRRGSCSRIGRGISLECMEGRLWLTWKGSGDRFLGPGEKITVGSKAVAEALENSKICFSRTDTESETIKNRRQIPAADTEAETAFI